MRSDRRALTRTSRAQASLRSASSARSAAELSDLRSSLRGMAASARASALRLAGVPTPAPHTSPVRFAPQVRPGDDYTPLHSQQALGDVHVRP